MLTPFQNYLKLLHSLSTQIYRWSTPHSHMLIEVWTCYNLLKSQSDQLAQPFLLSHSAEINTKQTALRNTPYNTRYMRPIGLFVLVHLEPLQLAFSAHPANKWRSPQTSLKTQKMVPMLHTHTQYVYLVPHLTPTAVTTWDAGLKCVPPSLCWNEHESITVSWINSPGIGTWWMHHLSI